jgi:uncharacterized protein
MQFNVVSLLKEATGATREYDIDAVDVATDGEPVTLSGHARFDRTPRGIFVRASFDGVHDEVCSRCLRPITIPIHIEFQEEYLPTVDVVTGAPADLEEGDQEAYRISPNHVIDLAEPAREYWQMALPMAPLCRDDCPGLCPLCGTELSDVGHACTREQVDARWAKLAGLRERL